MQCQRQKLGLESIERKNKLIRKLKVADFGSSPGFRSAGFAPIPNAFIFWKRKKYRNSSLIIWQCCLVFVSEIHLWFPVFDKKSQTYDAKMWIRPKIDRQKASVLKCPYNLLTKSNILNSDHVFSVFVLDIYITIWEIWSMCWVSLSFSCDWWRFRESSEFLIYE